MKIDANRFVRQWIEAWNSHDLEKILSHYTADFEITTPMIKSVMGMEVNSLKGREAVRKYWAAALQKMPELYFELKEVTVGVDSIAVYYRSVLGKHTIEVMFINDEGKIHQVIAHYT